MLLREVTVPFFFYCYFFGSIRRGLQVYREVCSQCHSINLVAFRTLEGVVYSEAEVKEFATEYEIQDGPGDDGKHQLAPFVHSISMCDVRLYTSKFLQARCLTVPVSRPIISQKYTLMKKLPR